MNYLVNLTMLYFLIASTVEEDRKVNEALAKRRAARGLYRLPNLESIKENQLLEEEMEKEYMDSENNYIIYMPEKGFMMTFEEKCYLAGGENVIDEEDAENLNSVDEEEVSENKTLIEKTTNKNFSNIDNSSEEKSGLFSDKEIQQILKERNVDKRKRKNHRLNKRFYGSSVIAV